MKKLISLLLAFMMLMTTVLSVSAEGDKTITITGTTDGHTYYAYQIFKGKLEQEPETVVLSSKENAKQYDVFEIASSSDKMVYKVFNYNQDNTGKDPEYYLVSSIPTQLPAEEPADAESLQLKKYVLKDDDVKTPSTVQHMNDIEWGKGITDDAKAMMYVNYVYVLDKTNKDFETNYKVLKAKYDEEPAEKGYTSLYDYIVKTKYAGVESEAIHAVANSELLRGSSSTETADMRAIALANLLTTKIIDGKEVSPLKAKTDEDVDSAASTAGSTLIKVDSDDGYYLIVDEISNSDAKDKAVSRYMIDVAGDVVVANKGDAPKVVKKVLDKDPNNAVDEKDVALGNFNLRNNYELTGGVWNDNADYSIGDDVMFRLYGTLPLTYDGYSKYTYIFNDTLSEGLTIDSTSIAVFVINGTSKTPIYENGKFDDNVIGAGARISAVGNSLTVTIDDLKTLFVSNNPIKSDSVIIVEYTARLNEKAVIGRSGNTNKVNLEYSNNPNPGHEGEKGKTTEDTVVVYTYGVQFKKVDTQDNNVTLAGAHFKLKRVSDSKWYSEVTNQDNDVSHVWVDDKEQATEVVSIGDGTFGFKGLEDGAYELYETAAPFGYTKPAETSPFLFKITSELKAKQDGFTGSLVDVTVSIQQNGGLQGLITNPGMEDPGIVTANVTNSKQDHLPTTGGVGTTMMYVGGGILVLAAGLLLVAKKKISNR